LVGSDGVGWLLLLYFEAVVVGSHCDCIILILARYLCNLMLPNLGFTYFERNP
jgi:hypothetical protein